MRCGINRFNQQCRSITDYIISVLHDLNGTECQALRKFHRATIIYVSKLHLSKDHSISHPQLLSARFRAMPAAYCMCIAMCLIRHQLQKGTYIRKEIKSINLNLANYVDQPLTNFTFDRNRFLLKRYSDDIDNPREVLVVCTQNQRMVSVQERMTRTIDKLSLLNNYLSLNNKT